MSLQPLGVFAAAVLLAVVNMSIVDYLAEPVRRKYPDLDLWWLLYVALGTGGVIGWFANLNLFLELIPSMDPLAGRILTCVLIGGGSSLLHKVFKGTTAETVVKMYRKT